MNITAHWELKAVAVVLAVALYIYTSGQVRTEKTMTVSVTDVSIRGLTADYQVVGVVPREFKVQLSVPSSRLIDFESETIQPRLELRPEQLAAEAGSWPLTSALLRMPNDVRIISTEPPNIREITLRLDRITEGTLPVEMPHITGLTAGLEPVIRLDQTMVHIAAGGDVLEILQRDHERIRFQDIDLRSVDPDLAGEIQERVLLTPLPAPQETPYKVLGQVQATVTIRPLVSTSKELTAPIALLANRDLLRSMSVELNPPRVALTLRGPQNLLNALRPEALTAFVRLADNIAPDAVSDLPVEVLAPSWLVVEPTQVRVKTTPIAKP